MRLGKVIGRVWSTVKNPQLNGIKLSIIQPVDEKQISVGAPLVAADPLNCGQDDLIYWVGGAEATMMDPKIPSDVTIVGLVDSLNL